MRQRHSACHQHGSRGGARATTQRIYAGKRPTKTALKRVLSHVGGHSTSSDFEAIRFVLIYIYSFRPEICERRDSRTCSLTARESRQSLANLLFLLATCQSFLYNDAKPVQVEAVQDGILSKRCAQLSAQTHEWMHDGSNDVRCGADASTHRHV